MKVSYNIKKNECTIKLSWTETRQFVSGSESAKILQQAVRDVMKKPVPMKQGLQIIKQELERIWR